MGTDNLHDELSSLVAGFRLLSVDYAAANARGDYDAVNHISDNVKATFHKILSFGNEGRDELIRLVDDPDKHVALSAAVYSLRHDPERCKAVLRRLSSEPGMFGFSARQSIVNWDTGKWALEEGFTPPANDQIPQVASMRLVPQGMTYDELAKTDGEIGELFRGMERRANMTDEELAKMMADREDEP